MKPVSEVLHRRQGTLWHVHPDDSVFAALELLAAHEIGALLVMDGGRLVGVVSERDYTRKVALQGRNSRETRVAEIMTRDVVRVPPAAPMHECMALMSEHRVRHLPVVDGSTVLGMISMRDLLDELIAEQERTIAELEHYIQS
ncbi:MULTISPECIES: CBS domain-containing protein [unclassified Rubrivivax]|uniref:CBS domain-containing protein n=1 Tax=unclassified Rubrivivax TaxID=2649762 RepID=UPI001E53A876|nr:MULTISPECIES: CBS domain-containing protein [unclassified Rubrivivax]MCC9595954.1 CBS domain-containing protein [Rubrivivax sp. JA1055]MCC9647705.1 CBS domain-containing protein [Rubrivivax sp. JA1029]